MSSVTVQILHTVTRSESVVCSPFVGTDVGAFLFVKQQAPRAVFKRCRQAGYPAYGREINNSIQLHALGMRKEGHNVVPTPVTI